MTVAAERADAPSPAFVPPPGNPRFALFDSLRGLAVLGIFLVHVAGVSTAINKRVFGDAVTALGGEAPTLFFAISGFLLYRPFVAAHAGGRPRPRISRYARRRVLRIVPAYWVALTLLAIFPGIAGVFSGDWWRYYFFLQLYDARTTGLGIPVAWTLCVEVSFYAALPLLVLAARGLRFQSWLRAELALVGCVFLASAAVQIAAGRQLISDQVATALPGQIAWMAVGMLLAIWSVAVEGRESESRLVQAVVRYPGACWAVAIAAFAWLSSLGHGLGAFAVVEALTEVEPYSTLVLRIVLMFLITAGLLLPAVFGEHSGGLPRRLLTLAPLVWIGVISYSMYLFHLTLIELIGLDRDPLHYSADAGLALVNHVHHGTTVLLFVVSLAATCAVGALSYRFVELPFLRRK